MNMLIWNCNGAASQNFLRRLKDLLCRYKPVLFGLLETRCSGDHANKICNQIGYDHWIRVEALGYSGESGCSGKISHPQNPSPICSCPNIISQ